MMFFAGPLAPSPAFLMFFCKVTNSLFFDETRNSFLAVSDTACFSAALVLHSKSALILTSVCTALFPVRMSTGSYSTFDYTRSTANTFLVDWLFAFEILCGDQATRSLLKIVFYFL
jgi:hypothetical protein